MNIIPFKIPGAYEIILKPFKDERGYFMRTYDPEIFREYNLQTDWKQENQSGNFESGIIRGFHFQKPPHTETKLVRAVAGRVLDVFVDLRKNSPSYLKWEAVELSVEKHNMVYIPKGCAHAYCTISEQSIVAYKVDSKYAPQSEGGIKWDDKTLNIPWPLENEPLISDKDSKLPYLQNFESPFTF